MRAAAQDFNEGRTTDRQWAELLATNGQIRDRLWAESHGRRHVSYIDSSDRSIWCKRERPDAVMVEASVKMRR